MNNIEIDNLFPSVIGQDSAKRKLAFHLANAKTTGVFPHTLLVAPRGCGKTLIAKSIGKNLPSKNSPASYKPFYEISCSSVRNLNQFYYSVLLPHGVDQEATFFLDEASELPRDVTIALLTVLNPNPDNRTVLNTTDWTFECDFKKHTFLFATTEAHKIFHALVDRTERIELEEYTHPQLALIMSRTLKDVKAERPLLMDIATVLRGNARAAQKLGQQIRDYATSNNKTKLEKSDWEDIKRQLDIKPLGLSQIELQILRIVKERGECSLTQLSSVTGLTRQCLQGDIELFLLKHRLMEIRTKGRSITPKGMKYLKDLK